MAAGSTPPPARGDAATVPSGRRTSGPGTAATTYRLRRHVVAATVRQRTSPSVSATWLPQEPAALRSGPPPSTSSGPLLAAGSVPSIGIDRAAEAARKVFVEDFRAFHRTV